MNLKEKIRNITSHQAVESGIFIIIILSTLMILIEKLFSFSTPVRHIIFFAEQIVLIIFSVEFLLKLYADGTRYFIKNYGWIDLLAALPVLIPVLESLVIRAGINSMSTSAGAEIVKSLLMVRMIRLVRIIRILRILRVTRLLKILPAAGKDQTKIIPLGMAAASVILVMIIAYAGIFYHRNSYINRQIQYYQKVLSGLPADQYKTFFQNDDYLLMMLGSELLLRKISNKEFIMNYQASEYISINISDYLAIISIKQFNRLLNIHEACLVVILALIIGTFVLLQQKIRE
ncbi:MAG: hypothetical protein A2096_01405 [Spirochaetes bacterium GWF1_41_5]|nr:MAG: hypothetical protein A2096_01405 [Spirochaetes bacterium GWF1_41_5]